MKREMRHIKVGQFAFSALFEHHRFVNSSTRNGTFFCEPKKIVREGEEKMRVHVCGRTQRMAGYEILFSMVVCLLFAFGFASLRAVRALFVKDTFSACVRILIFLLLFFFVSFRFVSFTHSQSLRFFSFLSSFSFCFPFPFSSFMSSFFFLLLLLAFALSSLYR